MNAISMARRAGSAVLSAAALVAGGAASAEGQSADLFDPTVVHEVRLYVNARDLHDLRARYQENVYYPADLHWGDVTLRNVGIRSRGRGSRTPVKLGLHLEFGYYATGQRLRGLAALDLDNLWQDPSMLREYAAMALFARMGQRAPRESFARLFINGAYQGVYAIVEPIDAAFLTRTAGGADGYLFEYHWLDPYELTGVDSDLDAVEARFERRTQRSVPRASAYAPVVDMLRAINAGDEERWRAGVDPYVDLPQFLTHIAVEQFLSEHDGLTGYDGVNNFYLYRPAASTRHQFLPWDRDHAFHDARSSIFLRAERNVLLRRALAVDDLRAYYLAALARCADVASREGWLEGVIAAGAALIADAASEDPLKPYDAAAHAAAVQHLTDFARSRPAWVREAVAGVRAAPA